MGEDSAVDLFYTTNDDGTYTQIEPANFTESEYTTTAEIPETELPVVMLGRMEPVEMEIPMKKPAWAMDEKFFRCGSRKRYVKKLMSFGVPRNVANRAAELVQILEISYTGALTLDWYSGRWGFWMKQKITGCGGFAV